MKKRLFIIDGHALCYRAYYAFMRNPLVNSKGQNTSAIYGFARMLFKLAEDQKPDCLAVAFDPPVKSFRFRLYEPYKATRQKTPEDLKSQINEIKRMVETMGLPVLENDEYEADDLLGSAAAKYSSLGFEVVLVTGDKDAFQLLKDGVSILAPKKGISEYEIMGPEEVSSKLGISPSQMVDYLALMGDSSDNIPGVPGIGEKSAQKLIAEFGSLDEIYRRIADVQPRQRKLLEEGRESAELSRNLATIRTEVSIDIDTSPFSLGGIMTTATRKFFEEHEMNALVKDYYDGGPISTPPKETVSKHKDYRIIRDINELTDMLKQINTAGTVSVDTETTSISPAAADLVGISFSIEDSQGWYIPMISSGLFGEGHMDPSESLAAVKPLLEDDAVRKVGQNIKYDIIVLARHGIRLAGVYFDTMVASYILDASERRHNLDDMAMQHLNYKTTTYKELTGTGKNALSISEVELEKLADYAIEDADIALRLYRIFEPRIKKEGLEDLFFNVEMKLVQVLADMEAAGVLIDTEHFAALSAENEKLLFDTQENIFKEADGRFNINSTKELSAVLFDRLGLKPVKKTKTGFSTDITVLEALRGHHAIVNHLISYRTLSKLGGTYIDALPKLINPLTGRIHTSYNQTVVATGRLSSSDPNLQNIPIRTEFGRKIRAGFVAQKGFLILAADYSQIELRLAAHLSGDENMIAAFIDGVDIHTKTAASVFGVGLDDVTSEMRRQAKIINFATIYGVSPFGLSQQAEIGVKEAAEFIRLYFETYPGFKNYMDRTIAFAKEHGYVETMLGRRRAIPEIDSSAQFRREGAERIAINTPIQGTSADMIKIAMIRIHESLISSSLRSRLIMQVHDELVLETAEDELENVKSLVTEEMRNAIELKVPIEVTCGFGKTWDEAH